MHKLHLVFVIASLALAACGSKDKEAESKEGGGGGGGGGGAIVASCDQRNMPGAAIKNCLEYRGSAWTKREVKSRCGMEGQAFLEGPCPTEGAVFSCLQEGGQPMEALIRYYENVDKARKYCEGIGVPQ